MPSKKHHKPDDDPEFSLLPVVSATEMTGILPVIPASPDQINPAAALYAVQTMEMKRKNKSKRKQ